MVDPTLICVGSIIFLANISFSQYTLKSNMYWDGGTII